MKINETFYAHLFNINELLQDLESLDISEEEKEELYELAHSQIHHAIMDEILSQLSDEDKSKFIDLLSNDENEKLWNHLNEKIDSVEKKITIIADQLIKELRQDINETSADQQ